MVQNRLANREKFRPVYRKKKYIYVYIYITLVA
jgi:hypothetical protein